MVKVVLVEDDVYLAEIYQTRVQLAGFDCKVANDGQAGLELIKQESPDLVLLDLMLPQLSGEDVLRGMRTSDWGKDIKVIILTNISEYEAPDTLPALGFERYIVKANLQHDQLIDIIKDVLKLPGSTETTEAPAQAV